ncbi:MAG: hypothetical protein JKY71_06550 [Alphaproteobacteria bacterium]|nr:hypothetical protein [Alphaproteobacteria bacterium]
MTTVPAGIAAQAAITQQNVALSVIKQNAQADQAIAAILAESAETVAAATRGNNVNIRV